MAGVHVLSPGQKVRLYAEPEERLVGATRQRRRHATCASRSTGAPPWRRCDARRRAAARAVRRFNISSWALEHPALTRYLLIVLMVLGFASYFQLGQDEDPPFTFRAMVVQRLLAGRHARSRWPSR